MDKTGIEYTISNYENGKPNRRLLFQTILYYFLTSGIFIFMFYVLFTNDWQSISNPYFHPDYSIFQFLSILFLFLGILVLILGMLNLRQEMISVGSNGISLSMGRKRKEALWSDVIEIRGTSGIFIMPIGSHFVYGRDYPMVVIKTNNWKHKIKHGNFKSHDIIELFKAIVNYALSFNINIVDEQGWLPETVRTKDKISMGIPMQLRAYFMIRKIGIVILCIGGLMALFGLLNEFYLHIGGSILILGIVCVFFGWLGIGDEKQKMEKRKNTKMK